MSCSTCKTLIFETSNIIYQNINVWCVSNTSNVTMIIPDKQPAYINYSAHDGLVFDLENDTPQTVIGETICNTCNTSIGWKCTFCYTIDTDMCNKFYIYKNKCSLS